MKYLLMLVPLIALSGCGAFDRAGAYWTGYTEVCAAGVLYYQFPSGVTVAYTPDGTIKTCN